MEEEGYSILRNLQDPEKLRNEILPEIKKLSREGSESDPLYYVRPKWGTLLYSKIKDYVEYGINYHNFIYFSLDGLNPRGMVNLVRVVGCREAKPTDIRWTSYMLGPQDYHTRDAIVLVRPIANEVCLRPFKGSHLMSKSDFRQSEKESKPQRIRRHEAIGARTTLWTEWSNFSQSDEFLFALVVYCNGPAWPSDEPQDSVAKDIVPFMRY